MASVWGELKRRNVVKVAVAYAIVGWLLVQVADIFFPALQLPEWTVTLVASLVVLGFPLALILSWAYELTPDGVERTKSVPLSEGIAKVTGRKLDFVIIGLLVLGVGFMFVDNYVLDTAGPFAGAEIDPSSLEPALDEPPSTAAEPTPSVAENQQGEVLPNSVAVLPFENLSPDPDNAYYAAGIHEEILNQLAKLSALNVIARTSMRQYADTEKSIPEIAVELNVETVMEGSVRYAGGQIRITAQLNDGVTGAHLWSETYTRDFDDIFAIESDVAMNVANALEAQFSLADQENIEKIPTNSSEAYALFLKAVSELSSGNYVGIRNRMEPLLLDAIALDPAFALASVYLARVYAIIREEALTLEYAQKALELDPDSGLAYAAISFMYYRTGRFEEALKFSEQAFQRSPTDSFVIDRYADDLLATGHVVQAIGVLARAVELDPVNAELYSDLGWTRWHSGDRDGGIIAMRRAVELDPETSGPQRALGMMETTLGNIANGVAQVQLAERLAATPNIHTAYSYRVAGLREDAARVARASADEEFPAGILSVLYHLVLDDEEQALDALVRLIENPPTAAGPFIWVVTNAFDDPTLEKPEFAALRAELRAKVGWN
jgi:TolB-like protein/Flp pilus assembly protein TadD